jgi:hypothetical protein
VFPGSDGGLRRRSNFRQWVWLPALAGVSGIYSHVTRTMIEAKLTALQKRWESYSTWTWTDHPQQDR